MFFPPGNYKCNYLVAGDNTATGAVQLIGSGKDVTQIIGFIGATRLMVMSYRPKD